jgi:hypothetical protein
MSYINGVRVVGVIALAIIVIMPEPPALGLNISKTLSRDCFEGSEFFAEYPSSFSM